MRFIGRIQDDYFLDKENGIVIYGCGKIGRQILEELKKRNLNFKIQAFCDGNVMNMPEKYIGKEKYPILDVQKACETYPDAAFLVASCCVKEMVLNLKTQGITNIHITRIGD